VVLLLLVVVAQLSLALSRHPTLRLSHLVRIVGARRIALVLVEALDVRGRVGAAAVVLAHGMVALGAAHALLCFSSAPSSHRSARVHTIVGVGARCRRRAAAAHDRHRLAPCSARLGGKSRAKRLSALEEIFRGTVDFCEAWSVCGLMFQPMA
jgi:hypothetical protein